MTTKIKGTEYTLFIDEWDIARMVDNNTNKVVSAWEADENTIKWFKETHCNKEEQTMNTNTKKISFEIRQLDAWGNAEDGYEINTSYQMGEMQTMAKDEKKAFTAWMKRHLGISFKPNRTLIEYDGDCYTIIDRKTKEPLFIAIPDC